MSKGLHSANLAEGLDKWPRPVLLSWADAATWLQHMLMMADGQTGLPQQLGVLASGLMLLISRQYLSQQLQDFDSQGFPSLVTVWVTVAAALLLGRLCWVLAKSAAVGRFLGQYVAPQQHASGPIVSVPCSKSARQHGQLLHNTAVPIASSATEDEDDIDVQKRKAQAEAAAKLTECQANLQQVLSSLRKSRNLLDNAQLLHMLADQLFNSPLAVTELVNQGGVPVVMSAVKAHLRSLQEQQADKERALPAVLQVSWVLLQIAHGPPVCLAALAKEDFVAETLLATSNAVMEMGPGHLQPKESILRNLMWVLLVLCDYTRSSSADGSSSSPSPGSTQGAWVAADSTANSQAVKSETPRVLACIQALHAADVMDVLQQLVTLQHGLEPGWVAAAILGLFTQMQQHHHLYYSHNLQRQQQRSPVHKLGLQLAAKQLPQYRQGQDAADVVQALSAAAVNALLQPTVLHGVGYLLTHQPQLCGRMKGLVLYHVQHLLKHHAMPLLQQLVEQHLVGSFARGTTQRLSRRLVCNLLSTAGQALLTATEDAYELDVPLALAQIIPLPVHVKLSLPAQAHRQLQQQYTNQQHQQPEQGEAQFQPAAETADLQQPVTEASVAEAAVAAAGVPEDVFTDMLACRLLLQHGRLKELLQAFCEEISAGSMLPVASNDSSTATAAREQLTEAADDERAEKRCFSRSNSNNSTRGCQPSWQETMLPPVCSAVLDLARHLMTRDLELQAVQHMRGDTLDDASTQGSADSCSSTSSVELALAMPDEAGVYRRVLQGLVAEYRLAGTMQHVVSSSGKGAASAAAGQVVTADAAAADDISVQSSSSSTNSSGGLFVLPPLPSGFAYNTRSSGSSDSTGSNSKRSSSRHPAIAVFKFQELEHAVDWRIYKRISHSSKLVHSILHQHKPAISRFQPLVVTEFAIPYFTAEANCWVLRCLERWLLTDMLEGFTAQQAAKLWVAADFLQVDGLQVACENVMAAAFACEPECIDVALELCTHHTGACGRLQRLAAQGVLRTISISSGSSEGSLSAHAVVHLQRLMLRYKEVLWPGLHGEMKDRLVTLCLLNAGLDADTPDDSVA